MAFLVSTLQNYSRALLDRYEQKEKIKQEIEHEIAVQHYFKKFLHSCKFSESAFIRTSSIT